MSERLVTALLDEWKGLSDARRPWEAYWRTVARYVLPQTANYDMMLGTNWGGAINSVVDAPAASRRSADLYDMTSLWAIERLAAGILSLKTPESQNWQDLGTDSLFGEPNTHEEKLALERLRDYMFKRRNDPKTGFWPAHKSAIRSMCAFGDGWLFIKEMQGVSAKLPYSYQYMPLIELYPGVDATGRPDRMFRLFRLSAIQMLNEYGEDKLPDSVKMALKNPKDKHKTFRILHAVRPRSENDKLGKIGVRGADFASFYIMPDEQHLLGEGGFNEFPFVRYAWNNSGTSPYSEGPVAYAIGELRSLQEMARNELIAVQQVVRPAYATFGKNFQRLNLNPGQVNPGLINGRGEKLFEAMNSGVRPDFAQGIMEARRNSVRELLYLNLWQIILQDKNDTATEALIRAQEKGELLGPVGISLNDGLSMMTDREIAILGRKGAFEDGSPLAMPDSMGDREVTPTFTSPLDRLRRMSELIGMQRLVEFATMLSGNDPNRLSQIMARFDNDEMLERAQEILGAPASSLTSRETADEGRQQGDQTQQAMMALEAMKQGGDAAKSIGEGAAALGQGAEVANASPALPGMLSGLPAAAAESMPQ
jgi:hypothetical protein